MCFKKFTLIFLMGIMCLSFNELKAQQDATISPDEILYWIGEGSNEAVFIVNWNNPDTALAWGYRFNDNSLIVKDMMDDIATVDGRFSYEEAGGFINNIYYRDGDLSLSLSGSYWLFNVNGVMAADYFNVQTVTNGDYVKCGDESCATDLGNWNYVWTKEVAPVNKYFGIDTAIHCDSSIFVAWAKECIVTRGYQQINDPNLGYASYGEDNVAIGKADNNVVSLGDGGFAILTFDTPIYNGAGADFAVFENSFNDTFLELAFVEVSSDGENYFRFPAISLTQTEVQVDGFGSVDATKIHNLAGKYKVFYGTPFDLDDIENNPLLNKDAVTHIRIVDVVGSIDPEYGTYDSENHIINEPWPTPFYSSGFDLDAVGVIHDVLHQSVNDVAFANVKVYPNPAINYVKIEAENIKMLKVFNTLGQLIMTSEVNESNPILDISNLQNGMYFIDIELSNSIITKKIIKK